tara:strand:- start:230 stop:919 length:690 start_codon:yes stop_codon:yes gene_type:complete
MRISRQNLKRIVESFLVEDNKKLWVCPKCGHKHEKEPSGKCSNCSHPYDDKFQGKSWSKPKLVKSESVFGKLYEQAKNFVCPTATQDLGVNTANRDRAIKLDWIIYGPLNVELPGKYWEKIAKKWKTTPEAAKESNCGNCVAFDRSPKMVDECIPAITTEPVADEFGVLGYCWMHHFKCHSARTCNTWAAGGPIKTDASSAEWFERNEEGALKQDPIDPDIYKDDTELE